MATTGLENSVVIDTGFLIAVFNTKDSNHLAANKFYRFFIRNGFPMIIPTIVISEYVQKAPITDIINTGNFIVAPFNYDDSVKTGEIAFHLSGVERGDGERANAKDDIKIIAQAVNLNASYVITGDAKTMYRYCEKLKSASLVELQPIKLTDGFDGSFFTAGQTGFDLGEDLT